MTESVELAKSMTMETIKGGRKKTGLRYNRYGGDFLVDKIKPDEVGAELVSVGDLIANQEWQIADDDESFWQENHSVPKREMDLQQCETEKREETNFRILEWIYGRPVGEEEGQSRQQVNLSVAKDVKERNPSVGWIAAEQPLDISSTKNGQ